MMTRMQMPVPVTASALRRDTDLANQNRHFDVERRYADLVFEMWHRDDDRTLSNFIIGALGQAT